MREALATATGYHRPFHIVRDCLSGNDAPARKRLGELLIASGKPEEAIEILSEMEGDAEATADRIYNAAVELWNAARSERNQLTSRAKVAKPVVNTTSAA